MSSLDPFSRNLEALAKSGSRLAAQYSSVFAAEEHVCEISESTVLERGILLIRKYFPRER